MAEAMLPWFTTLLIGLAVLLIMVITTVMLHRMARGETTSFYCPWAGRKVTVRFLASEQGSSIGVVSCTAFADPRVVTCAKHCVCGEERGDSAVDETPTG